MPSASDSSQFKASGRARTFIEKALVAFYMDPVGSTAAIRAQNAQKLGPALARYQEALEKGTQRLTELEQELRQFPQATADRKLAKERAKLEKTLRDVVWTRESGQYLDSFLTDPAQQRHLQETTVREMLRDRPAAIAEKLYEERPVMRWLAVQVIGRKRLPLARELIELLSDASGEVRKAAHDALVRVARGTDFGPHPGTTSAQAARAVQRWRDWLAAQDPPEAAPTNGP